MDAVLGLLLLAVFAACIITLAAAMTWIVVKVSPSPQAKQQRESSS